MKLSLCAKIRICLFALLVIPAAESYSAPRQEKWVEHRAKHFLIYYKNVPQDFIATLEEQAEYYFDEITHDLVVYRNTTWIQDNRARIYVYDDQQDYISAANNMKWSHGITETRKKVIRTFPSSHGFFDSTLPHELAHIIFREFVGFQSNVPTWLDEGVATNQEKAKRWGAHKTVLNAIKQGKFIPLGELKNVVLNQNVNQEILNLYYAEAASIVNFMKTELGSFRFYNFCENLKRGHSLDNAIKLTYVRFENVDDLNKAWIKFLEDLD